MAKPIEERRAIVSPHLLRRVALRKREKAREMRRARIEPELIEQDSDRIQKAMESR